MNQPVTLSVGGRFFQHDRIFSSDPRQIRDQANAGFVRLRDAALQIGIALATEDIHPPNDSKVVIDLNAQKWKAVTRRVPIRYLITIEPPVVYPNNWFQPEHLKYDKIFTWDDSLIDNKRYFLLRYAHNLGVEPGLPSFEDRKLAATIIGFKSASHLQEQYSERFELIRWFLENHPKEFALYGAGWPRHFRPPGPRRIEQFFSRPLDILLGSFYPVNLCYLGPVADKIKTFSQYRFAFCYENTASAMGYITEKIFDAFRAGCVPVYLGPPNVNEHIPDDCFIDRRQFSSHEQLYVRLKSMEGAEFLAYQERIYEYLKSPQAHQFTPAHFATVLLNHMSADLGLATTSDAGECESNTALSPAS